MPKWTVWEWAVIMDFVAQAVNKHEFPKNPNNLNNLNNPCNPYNPNPLNDNGVDRVYTLPGLSHCTPVKAFNQALEDSHSHLKASVGAALKVLQVLEVNPKAHPQAKVGKAQVDKLIDLAAPPPRGTGVENIRECIIESKMTFDVSSDDWQAYLKAKIMNNIERYFYLIVFAMYIRELGPKGFPQTFKQFMDDHSGLRTMIEEGRGKLEWERKIPDEKLAELKDMLSSADFKANMPKVIKRIYELSWDMFGDLPRGHHKNNSMHKLASKTMIEILPENLANHVEKKCGSLAGTPDFFDVIGQVSWYEPEA